MIHTFTITVYDQLGLVGVFVTILAYFFLQFGSLELRGWLYSFLNALGSLLILVSLVKKFNLAAFTMESIWFFISLYGFYRVHLESIKKRAYVDAVKHKKIM